MKIDVYKHSQRLSSFSYLNEDLKSGNKVYIGRDEDCHVELDDQQISRKHLEVFVINNIVHIKNLSSYSSVLKNGKEVPPKVDSVINNGERIIVGDFELLFTDVEAKTISAISVQNEDLLEETQVLEEMNIEKDVADEDRTDILEEEVLPAEDEVSQVLDAEFPDSSEDIDPGFDEDNNEPDGFDNDSGFEDDSGFESDGDAGDSTQVFQSFAKYYLILDGEHSPFDKYLIEDSEIKIGRDPEKCQICLNDSEVSGVHAIIKKSLINCIIEDQSSSNGTIYNGNRINKAELSNGDSFEIGSTMFRVEISSELINSESDRLMPVAENQFVEVEEIVEEEVNFDADGSGDGEFGVEEVQEKSLIKKIMKDPKKKRLVLFGGVGLVLLLLLGGDDTDSQKSSKKTKKTSAQSKKTDKKKSTKQSLSKDTLEKLEENYLLALSKFEAGEYYAAKEYLEVIRGIAPDYKDTPTLRKLVEEGLRELLKQKAKEEEEKERKARQIKIEALLERTRKNVEKRQVSVSESLFSQILEIDPENMDVPQLKLELDAYKAEVQRKKNEKIRKRELRKAMVDALAPGKGLYLKSEWFKAIDRLDKFTKKEGMDEDLIKEATDMLKDAKVQLGNAISPLIGRARSLKEGQDLKRAFETYGAVLKYEPSHEESLNERDQIFEQLRIRSMKLYREALISESLSLFEEARDQFKEVQQISPINSEYYNKATDKLKNYLE